MTVGSCVLGDFVPYTQASQLRPRAAKALLLVERVEPVAVDRLEDVTADFHRRGELLVLDRERLVGDDEAAHFLDDRQLAR